MTATPSLGRTTAIQAAGTVLSRLTGFGRIFALAYAVGFTRLADAYNLANVTPNIIFELVLGGVLSATLVPVFVDQFDRARDPWRAISAVVTVAVVLLVGVAALVALAAPWIVQLYVATNTDPSAADQHAVATALLRLFAPQMIFYGLITISTAVYFARRQFALPRYSQIFNNLVVIGVLLAVPHVIDDLDIAAVRHDTAALLLLGLGTTAAVAVQALVQSGALRRLRPVWDPGHPAVRSVLRLSGWTVGVVVTNQLALYVVLALANNQEGGVSAYQAAYAFFLLPHAIFAVSVMDALLPDLAARWSARDIDSYRQVLTRGVRAITVLVVPAAVGYVVLARPAVAAVLEHGAMSQASAATTANVLALFALGLPGFSLYLLFMRGFQAMKDTRSMFRFYAIENSLNVVLALALFPSMGVAGLGLAYGAAYTITAVLAARRLSDRIGGVDGARIRATAGRVALATAAMAVVAYGASGFIGAVLHDAGNVREALRVGAAVIAGVTVYAVVARTLHLDSALSRRGDG